jgi:hypothetical protein
VLPSALLTRLTLTKLASLLAPALLPPPWSKVSTSVAGPSRWICACRGGAAAARTALLLLRLPLPPPASLAPSPSAESKLKV